MARWRIGIDIGGAFTDLCAIDLDTGENIWNKVESTPPNYEIGVLRGVDELEELGVYVKDAFQIIHGQTIVINTVITRSGSKTGFVTTKGFDTIYIQRANRRDMFNFRYQKPKPFVSRSLIRWIDERIDSDGSVYKPLKEEEIVTAIRDLLQQGVESLAIGFINSYINDVHEKRVKEIAEKIFREAGRERAYVTISSELSREWREYERFNTAILNAYVQPIFSNYLEKLEKALREREFRGIFYLTLSSGGVVGTDYARKYPIMTIEGGSIASIMGGIRLASVLGVQNIIVIDGGSTTTKAGLVEKLNPKIYSEYWIERNEWNAGYPLRVPTLDIHEIGLGGTSIIWIDETGNLRIGPKAAGARPGPACYGLGGNEPTLTDAYVVTGYLNPRYLLGGKLKIWKEKAVEVMSRFSRKLNMDYIDLAYATIIIANDNAANLLRQISIRRGYDPREFTLIAHGGAGPMFAPFIAQDLKILNIIVPSIPSGVFNAWAMTCLNIRHEIIQTNVTKIDKNDSFVEFINKAFTSMENEIKRIFISEDIKPENVKFSRFIDMRYEGQAHTLKVECPLGLLTMKHVEHIENRFHEIHYNEYGFVLPDSGIEIVNLHVAGVYELSPPKINKLSLNADLEKTVLEEREIYFNGRETKALVYSKEKLPPKIFLEGPCIVEGLTSTIIIPKNFKAYHDEYGNMLIKTKEGM